MMFAQTGIVDYGRPVAGLRPGPHGSLLCALGDKREAGHCALIKDGKLIAKLGDAVQQVALSCADRVFTSHSSGDVTVYTGLAAGRLRNRGKARTKRPNGPIDWNFQPLGKCVELRNGTSIGPIRTHSVYALDQGLFGPRMRPLALPANGRYGKSERICWHPSLDLALVVGEGVMVAWRPLARRVSAPVSIGRPRGVNWLPGGSIAEIEMMEHWLRGGGKARDRHLWLYDAESGALSTKEDFWVDRWRVSISPDGAKALIGAAGGSYYVCTLPTYEVIGRLEDAPADPIAFVWPVWTKTPDTLTMVFEKSGAPVVVRRWRLDDLSLCGGAELPKTHSDNLMITGDGAHVLWRRDAQAITADVIDVTTGQPVGRLEGHSGPITRTMWDDTTSSIVTGSDDGTVRFWAA